MSANLKSALESGEFVVTAEVAPPKGTDLEEFEQHVELLKDKVSALNVTDHQSSVMRFPSIGGCMKVKEHGGETILQMTCRDRNRISLQADLLMANKWGIENVLCLTGDAVTVGDHQEGKGVFELDSVQLLRTIDTMEGGRDLGGNELNGGVSFCKGAIVTPEADPIEPQLAKFEKKVEAGAEFFQTQAVYDLDNFKKFMEYAGQFDVKILAGIVLLTSHKMAKYMTKNIPGIFVPEELIEELEKASKGEGLKKGIEIAGRMISDLKEESICDGVHIMAINKEHVVPEILEKAGI